MWATVVKHFIDGLGNDARQIGSEGTACPISRLVERRAPETYPRTDALPEGGPRGRAQAEIWLR